MMWKFVEAPQLTLHNMERSIKSQSFQFYGIYIDIGEILPYPPFFGGVQYPLVHNLLYQVTIFSHLIVSSSYCVLLTSHMTILLSHFVVSLYFFTFDCTILTLCSTNITCNCTFVTFDGFFFLTFDCTILTLCSTNFTCDCTFVTFSGSLIFFSHLIVSSSYCKVLTLHVTKLLSHLVVPLFFSHI